MSVIDAANSIINGCRNEIYGTAENSFTRIADYWNAYIHHSCFTDTDVVISAKDVAMMMVLFKLARLENNPNIYHQDNIVDMIGYAALYDRIMDNEYTGNEPGTTETA